MDLYLLLIVFIIIVFVLFVLKKPLTISIACGIVGSIILFQIPLIKSGEIVLKAASSSSTLTVLIILYVVTLLQRMMQHQGALSASQLALEKVFNNRRINAFVAPTFMGLLPSASAIYMAGDMVETSIGDEVSKEDKTFIASYFRHVFESFLPTYSSVIILVSLAKIDINTFVIGMIPMVIVYILLGYIFFLRKIDQHHNIVKYNKGKEIAKAFIAICPIIIILVLVMIFNIEVQYATLIVIVGYSIYQKYTLKEISNFIKSAFEPKVLLTTLTIFIFKDFILSTGVMEKLPELFNNSSIPLFIVYGVIFFVSTLLLGNSATYVIFIPLALIALPEGGASLFIYLNCISFMAMQVAPTHICLFLACEYFKTEMTSLIKRTIPVLVIFIIIATMYYILLSSFI